MNNLIFSNTSRRTTSSGTTMDTSDGDSDDEDNNNSSLNNVINNNNNSLPNSRGNAAQQVPMRSFLEVDEAERNQRIHRAALAVARLNSGGQHGGGAPLSMNHHQRMMQDGEDSLGQFLENQRNHDSRWPNYGSHSSSSDTNRLVGNNSRFRQRVNAQYFDDDGEGDDDALEEFVGRNYRGGAGGGSSDTRPNEYDGLTSDRFKQRIHAQYFGEGELAQMLERGRREYATAERAISSTRNNMHLPCSEMMVNCAAADGKLNNNQKVSYRIRALVDFEAKPSLFKRTKKNRKPHSA